MEPALQSQTTDSHVPVPSAGSRQFSGSERTVAEYLLAEVLLFADLLRLEPRVTTLGEVSGLHRAGRSYHH